MTFKQRLDAWAGECDEDVRARMSAVELMRVTDEEWNSVRPFMFDVSVQGPVEGVSRQVVDVGDYRGQGIRFRLYHWREADPAIIAPPETEAV